MHVVVNDSPLELAGDATVLELLRTLSVSPDRIAVEVNREIVPREDYGSRRLAEGDRIELITFVGGGEDA
ncbi:MAG: thiamine biosynthesis protein ThiS [Firmicutes bacterium RBG_13_65_8]|nr:MAG: thiamine biosynthesis protein ThiS [Firmicutes bacterium RBG_13_65_8]